VQSGRHGPDGIYAAINSVQIPDTGA
jgi:hypothetical protein